MPWKFRLVTYVLVLWALSCGGVAAQTTSPSRPCADANYGNDPRGRFSKVNGISLYYEIHGEGQPLLLIHGNGGSIDRDRCQIAYFSRSRRVIIADSRSHGRSENGPGRLTYEQIADDLSALLAQLNIEKIDVWGHSDGGIVALLLGIRHPSQVAKLVASSANLSPDALPPATLAGPRQMLQQATDMIKAGDRSQDWARLRQQKEMVLSEPHISIDDLHVITAPTLVIRADRDAIPVSHTFEIFGGIPSAQLFIVPGATHTMIRDESEFYNSVVARFLDRPFTKPQ